jgi:class 3 adenylate cyclase/tetratricopeptide (TPR) repeat protein
MRCPACQTENPDGNRFCRSCGAGLALACPACGAAIAEGDGFCGSCGAPLGAEPAPAVTAAAPATERRLVTVLFADLVGFTPLAEGRDSEEVRALLSRYFDTCRRLIELYGGVVEKFIGDAVMAVWGAHSATEDDAERAVRAALDLVASVSALGDELEIAGLRARAGVLTGEATVTLASEAEGMVAGDIVNTAARVQAVADPGQVLVGEATRRATEPTIVYEDAGSHELKGKAGLYQLWRAMRVVSGARGALKSTGLESPFVGRERELRQIKDLFHASSEEGRSHLVSVIGPAGIGKSRLVWEFYKYFDGLPAITYWHRGRCLAYGEGVTYWALADMVRMRCRIAEDEPAASAAPKLAAVVEEHIPDPEERRFVEPRVAHLLGLDDGGRYEREDLFAAWRLFFERLADVHPVVLVFEDIHWADASLLDFVEYLVEWSRQTPVYVIALARPEVVERRPTWGAARRNATSLYLDPLPQPAMHDLLTGLVPGLPESLGGRILDRAEGMPLYAMETVRMLLDRGQLVREGSVYRPAGTVEALAVPETLHALIAARLDGLSPDERRIVQDASVLGKTFTRDAVAAIGSQPPGEVESVLAGLVRKELFSIQADPRSPEHGQYGFLQDLVRHVAYETLSRQERRSRHLAAAEHLAGNLPEDEIVEVIASHYLDAHNAVPDADDAEDVRARARQLQVRAGEHAESLGAPSEAQRYFEQAANLSGAGAESAALLDRAGRMARNAARWDDAVRLYSAAIAAYEELGDAHASARVSTRLAWVDQAVGRFEEGAERMEQALAVIGDGEPDEDLALLLVRLGGSEFFAGHLERAAELVERGLDIAEAQWFPEVMVSGWNTKAQLVTGRGRPEEARGFFRAALDLALEHDLLERASVTCGNLSDLAFQRDRYEEALGYLDQALGQARRTGNRPEEWFGHSESTYALFMLGRWDEALAAMAEIPEERLPTGGVLLSPLTSVFEIHIHRGDVDEARRLLGVYARLETSADVQEQMCFRAAKAVLALAEGRHAEALETGASVIEARSGFAIANQAVKQAVVSALEAALALHEPERAEPLLSMIEALPRGLRPPFLVAQAHRIRARMAAGPAARRLFAAAASEFRELEIPFWTAVTQVEQAEALGAAGVPLEQARATLERLGASPWVERLDAVSGSAAVPAASAGQ